MKKSILLLLFLFTSSILFAQKQVFNQVNEVRNQVNATNFSPFSISTNVQTFGNTFVANNSVVQLNINSLMMSQIESTKPAFLNLSIPTSEKSSINLELIPNNIFSETHKVLNAQNQEVNASSGVFYKGIIKGDDRSLVSISIINGEISGIISNDKGNFNLGKLKNSNNYILYNDRELLEKPIFECGVSDEGLKKMVESEVQNSITAPNVACAAAQIYIEADNALYIAKGSTIPNATAFVNAVFNQVAVLYNNEGIVITISTTKIWDTVDPYAGVASNTSDMLTAFSNQVGNTFTGNLAHLFSTRNLGGGRAGLDVLCNKGKGVNGNMDNYTPNVPTFSWNVMVVAHEMGHNFGSPHTQSCSWPIGALDNCVATEGGCPAGPAPVNGGTIMSYCHVVAAGINFANGFGLYPGNLIRNRTQVCLGSAVVPSALTVVEVYNTTALLAWTHGGGGTYTVEYRIGAGAYTVVTSTVKSIQLSSLAANTTYEWRVKVGCSTYATSTFTTNSTPAIIYCKPTFSQGCPFGISLNDVIVGGINFNPASGCSGGYDLIYSPVRDLAIGQTFPFTINLNSYGNPTQVAIWIDFDKNGTFAAGEQVFTTTTGATGPITGSFAIPAGSTPRTNTRMRVIANFSSAPSNPCGAYSYGETEDFFINIGGNNCLQTLALVNPTDNITSGTVTKQAAATNGTINATNFVTGSGTRATYQSKKINLNPGFKADNGTIFKAEVGGCN